jgi:hypothetical protein
MHGAENNCGAMYKNGFGLERIRDRFGKSSADKPDAMKFLFTAP